MGRKSTKENKSIFQIVRENQDLTREQASDLLSFISEDRIEKIENQRILPHPDEILAMSEAYKSPILCNYFCSHECPIGKKYVPEAEDRPLSQLALEILASINSLDKFKNRLVEICVDGRIDTDEYTDFAAIRNELAQFAQTISSLQLWIEQKIATGDIDKDGLK